MLPHSPSLQQQSRRNNFQSSRSPISLLLCWNTPWSGMTFWGRSALCPDGAWESVKAAVLSYVSAQTTAMQEALSLEHIRLSVCPNSEQILLSLLMEDSRLWKRWRKTSIKR